MENIPTNYLRPAEVRQKFKLTLAENVDEVLTVALGRKTRLPRAHSSRAQPKRQR